MSNFQNFDFIIKTYLQVFFLIFFITNSWFKRQGSVKNIFKPPGVNVTNSATFLFYVGQEDKKISLLFFAATYGLEIKLSHIFQATYGTYRNSTIYFEQAYKPFYSFPFLSQTYHVGDAKAKTKNASRFKPMTFFWNVIF